jgi:dihydrofolate reductase
MSKVVVNTSLTLDGVMQAPGRPAEDLRGGFEHGGWALPYNDAFMGRVMGERIADAGPLLLGRLTYEDFASFWPHQADDNPYAAVINNVEVRRVDHARRAARVEQLDAPGGRRRGDSGQHCATNEANAGVSSRSRYATPG